MPTRVDINADVLTWAINRAGYDFDQFIMSNPIVNDWIENVKRPTVKQLENFSKKVKLPFGYLFLEEPLNQDIPIPLFRTGKKPTKKVSLEVYDTIQLLERRQEWLSDYLKDNDFEPLNFVGKFTIEDDYLEIVADIRKVLKLKKDWASNCLNWGVARKYLGQQIENARIIISFNSLVNNNTRRRIKVDECRGFVLVDEYAPSLFVNAGDAKSAQLFTMAHELAHLWIGQSAAFDNRQLLPADNPIELFCDKIAAEFLVPEDLFLAFYEENPTFQELAYHFKVSQIVIARRALDLGIITKGQFFAFYKKHQEKLKVKKAKQAKSGGGDIYLSIPQRINRTFASFVDRAVRQNQLLYRDAYKLTGLKGETYHKFINQHLY